jgi:hypothetical protein
MAAVQQDGRSHRKVGGEEYGNLIKINLYGVNEQRYDREVYYN